MSSELVLPSGEILNTKTGEIVGTSERAIDNPSSFVASRVRRADDLPPNGKAFAMIAAMTLWGMKPIEIAVALDKSFEFIDAIMQDEQFKVFMSEVIDGVLEAEVQDVRQIFVQNAARAARGMVQLMDSAVPDIKVAAYKETLDRAGFRPADIVEHRHKIENDLKIVYVGEKKETALDAEFMEITDAR